jgi:maltose alpha-D-glucosyltransferase/alpha-amylase
MLTRQLPEKPWFADRSRFVTAVRIEDVVPLSKRDAANPLLLLILRVEYREGEPGAYQILTSVAWGDAATSILERSPESALAHLRQREIGQDGVLFDATVESTSMFGLLELVRRDRSIRAANGEVRGVSEEGFVPLADPTVRSFASGATYVHHAIEAVVFNDQRILKLFRRIEPGRHPELEIGKLLGSRAANAHVPRLRGAIEYWRGEDDPVTLAMLQDFEPQGRSARQLAQDWVGRFTEAVLAQPETRQAEWLVAGKESLWQMAEATPPESIKELLAGFLDQCVLMGRRLAEFHLAIAQSDDPRFAPESCSKYFQRSSYQTARKLLFQTFQSLRVLQPSLSQDAQEAAKELLGKERELLEAFRAILASQIHAPRIRCHGSLNLGQVYFTGKDFVFSEFEHVLGRSHAARRIKQAALGDLAGLIYSLHIVALKLAPRSAQFGVQTPHASAVLHGALDSWFRWSSSALLKGYQEALASSTEGNGRRISRHQPSLIVPHDLSERDMLLRFYLLERSLSELADVLARQPESAALRIGGVLDLLAM